MYCLTLILYITLKINLFNYVQFACIQQVHIQTIGILVAEKTELQSTLNQSQRSAEQQIGQ